jgi:serine/threonine protein kinase/formylglycine-generating enzyme required for sulfatase activity
MNAPNDPNRSMDAPSVPADPVRVVDPTTIDQFPGSASTHWPHPRADEPAGDLPAVPGYRVLREIARGGMGRVLAAHDLGLDREVALKVLLPGANADRFVRESKITARLPHPGIPPVHALGTLADGSPFLAMKLVAGHTLAVEMKTADRPRLLQAFTQVCQAVGFAHSRGIIHRDLKPSNIMVGAFGEVQVMDWGLAKDLSGQEGVDPSRSSEAPSLSSVGTNPNQTTDYMPSGEATDDQTQAGEVLGTPAYMAPEQARGEATDARADVFALGSILCAILTGQAPFGGQSALEVIRRAGAAELAEANARLDGCGADAELLTLCRRCLSPRLTNRPADGQAVADALTAYLNGVQQRLQAAERERAVALARKTEQRKRRRVQMALGGLCFLVAVGLVAAGFWYQAQLHETRERARAETRAAELVKSLASSDTAFVPRIVEELTNYRSQAEPALAEMLANAAPESKARLHASLALLPSDPSQAKSLRERLLTATPAEIMAIRQLLTPHAASVTPALWAVLSDEKAEAGKRLRAGAALATFDPASERWSTASAHVVNDLVQENPIFLGLWSEALRPVKNRLLSRLSEIYDDHQPELTAERSLATNLLADFAADQPQVLANLLMNADEKQFAVIYPKFKDRGEQGVPILHVEIDKRLPPEVPSSDERRDQLAKRQANAAVALLRMNQPAKVWPLLRHSSDPRVRSYLVHRLSPLRADAKAIVQRLEEEPDLTIRRALMLSLGEFGEKDFPPNERKAMLPKLQEMYRTEADPGLHAASEWLLRTWKQEAWLKLTNDEWAKDKEQRDKRLQGIHQLLARDKEKSPPQWYVNGQGQTMVVVPGPVEFVMGSPPTEVGRRFDEPQHKKRIARTFALAATPVTKEQFLRFLPKFDHSAMHIYPDPTCPIGGVTWYEAAAYCNWLSREEKIPEDQWCYETDANGGVTRLKANYLSLTGYRLPTEAEMEYATRAGASTSRYFGETEDLLPKYAWYFKNSRERTWPVGGLKPNDLGLFDIQGNVYAWCQESNQGYTEENEAKASEDREDDLVVVSTSSRVLRGGSCNYRASNVRSADRGLNVPTARSPNFGVRPARTLTR